MFQKQGMIVRKIKKVSGVVLRDEDSILSASDAGLGLCFSETFLGGITSKSPFVVGVAFVAAFFVFLLGLLFFQ